VNPAIAITQKMLPEFLLHVAPSRPVFVLGQPGIGKTSLVRQFAELVGLPCVALLGTQLAPEDLIGVPEIRDGTSRFCPPSLLVRREPFCLFLDELNGASPEVQKAFYSLITEHRLGEYVLPAGSIIVGAGNRTQDQAHAKPMASALINRMVLVHLRVSHRDWLEWAGANDIHPWVLDYIRLRPDHLWSPPPKHEESFSSPRAWHILSDGIRGFGDDIGLDVIEVLAHGCLTPHHATQFRAFVKQIRGKYHMAAILKGDARWPDAPEDRDVLYFLAQSFRAQLVKELPSESDMLTDQHRALAHRAKGLLKDLATISLEVAQVVVVDDPEAGPSLPGWLRTEIVRDIPRLVLRADGR
jgi:hypothetical protein